MTILAPSEMPLMRPMPMEKNDSLRRWRLEEDYHLPFEGDYLFAEKGFVFDGASIPRFFRRIYSPVGYLFLAGLFHDVAYKTSYRHSKKFLKAKVIIHTSVDQEGADNLFRDITNLYYAEHKIKTQVAYRALRIGGCVAWNKHRGIKLKYVDPSKNWVEENHWN